MLSYEDGLLISHLHGGFPLVDEPYKAVAMQLGWSEERVLQRLGHLLAHGVLTRFGPLFQIERAGGLYVLSAMEVPEERFAEVAALVNDLPEIAHNYRRDHRLNMWFVIATETPDLAHAVTRRIEADTGLPVFSFPKEEEFFVELKLSPLNLERHHANR